MKKVITVGLMLISSGSLAGWVEGKVTDIIVRQSDGLHYFYVSGEATNRASCASGTTYWAIKDEHSLAGKSQLSLLLAAYAAAKTVRVHGTGKCERWSDSEDVNEVHLIK